MLAASFAANMAVKQNAADFSLEFPAAGKAVNESFYVDNGLVGADSIERAISLQHQLQELGAICSWWLHFAKVENAATLLYWSSYQRSSRTLNPSVCSLTRVDTPRPLELSGTQ